MPIKQKNYYQYIADTKDTTCKACSSNAGKIFLEDDIPTLPIHPNCKCRLLPLEYYQEDLSLILKDSLSEWHLNKLEILPKEKGRAWIKTIINSYTWIYHSNDGIILITFSGGQYYNLLEETAELSEYLNNKVYNSKNYVTALRKNILYNNKVAAPVGGVNGTIYKINENEYCYVQLSSLQGIGILPDGTIIIGEDRDKKTNDYYTQLLLLRSEYSILKRSHLTDSEFSYEYNKIHEEVINLIKKRYPNMSESEVADKYVNDWRNIPDDYYIVTDVTDKINNIIESYLTSSEWEQIKKSNYINRLNKFFNEVKNGSPIDIKNRPEWYHPLYIYNNEILDLDALGNILYGVLGAYLKFSVPELFIGASVAQTSDNGYPALDDQRDIIRWLQGMDLYYEWLKGDN